MFLSKQQCALCTIVKSLQLLLYYIISSEQTNPVSVN